ncbi:dipeptide epimerase [Biformimicrobium ophioploci]|uniref:Dipeptide epimerase n=1 Tax=Biformimicrobium ophioploci TaxID=3036711 RepID=A0ABQ6LZD5_9GAMM|nr:dipeptide epimerase [Microbulbifer sp. NKW57]GMG87421.1 dipeptide epimerase [Microbulbifer sp. NKW57]
MKITNIQFGLVKAPLKTPFKTAVRSVDYVEDTVVIVETDTGNRGYGTAPATALITGDTHGSIQAAIKHQIGPLLMGLEIENLNKCVGIIQSSMINNTSAKAALEIAVYDLFGQLYRQPLYKLLGGGEPALSTDVTISVDYIDKMVADSLSAVEAGFETLKIKVGKDIGLDIDRIKAIYSAVEGRALIRLDANQGWTAKQAVYALGQLESSGVKLELVEQPVKAYDFDGMRYITERVSTPVMADESAFSPKQVLELIRTRAADIINIKLMKTGGLSNAIKIADIAQIHDVECMIGCMLESSVGIAAAAHLAVAKAGVIRKIDLDVPSLVEFDPVSSNVVFSGPEIALQDTPGLGIECIENLQMIEA